MKNWFIVGMGFDFPKSVMDEIGSLKEVKKLGPFIIAYLVDNHPLYDWDDVKGSLYYLKHHQCKYKVKADTMQLCI